VKRMTAEDKALVRGIAMALASIVRSPPGNGAVEEVLCDAGLTAAVLRRAGVIEFDLDALRPALKRNREEERRNARPASPGAGGADAKETKP
jgi:hypothetical protein